MATVADEKIYPEDVAAPGSPPDNTRPLQLDDLPEGYFRSVRFIGSVTGVCLMAISLYLGFVLPVRPIPKLLSA
jgi:hypothetical protein